MACVCGHAVEEHEDEEFECMAKDIDGDVCDCEGFEEDLAAEDDDDDDEDDDLDDEEDEDDSEDEDEDEEDNTD